MSKMNLPNGTKVVLTSTNESATIIGREEMDFVVPRYQLKLDSTDEEIVVTAFEIASFEPAVEDEIRSEQKIKTE